MALLYISVSPDAFVVTNVWQTSLALNEARQAMFLAVTVEITELSTAHTLLSTKVILAKLVKRTKPENFLQLFLRSISEKNVAIYVLM